MSIAIVMVLIDIVFTFTNNSKLFSSAHIVWIRDTAKSCRKRETDDTSRVVEWCLYSKHLLALDPHYTVTLETMVITDNNVKNESVLR